MCLACTYRGTANVRMRPQARNQPSWPATPVPADLTRTLLSSPNPAMVCFSILSAASNTPGTSKGRPSTSDLTLGAWNVLKQDDETVSFYLVTYICFIGMLYSYVCLHSSLILIMEHLKNMVKCQMGLGNFKCFTVSLS